MPKERWVNFTLTLEVEVLMSLPDSVDPDDGEAVAKHIIEERDIVHLLYHNDADVTDEQVEVNFTEESE